MTYTEMLSGTSFNTSPRPWLASWTAGGSVGKPLRSTTGWCFQDTVSLLSARSKWRNGAQPHLPRWRGAPVAAACPKKQPVARLAGVVRDIRERPDSRRLMVSAWNPADVPKMALPPCHTLFQFYVDTEEQTLSCQLYQRSADLFLGVPFNIASYALLTMMVAQVTGLRPGDFVHTFGDLHIYVNHLEQVREQLSREPRPLPVMRLNPERRELEEFRYDDFVLEGYDPWPAIRGEVSV